MARRNSVRPKNSLTCRCSTRQATTSITAPEAEADRTFLLLGEALLRSEAAWIVGASERTGRSAMTLAMEAGIAAEVDLATSPTAAFNRFATPGSAQKKSTLH